MNLWYHVGSKNERPGRTGFAHLFEHLMFEGSEHHDTGYFQPLQGAGASLNGSTNADRTNYWEVVPTNALELALWMESDRMGYLLPALTEAKFANQRDVVLNERRQNYENRPYGLAPMAMLAALFPPDHPYHWTTIGEIADLHARAARRRAGVLPPLLPSGQRVAGASPATSIPTRRSTLARAYFGEIAAGPARWRRSRADADARRRARGCCSRIASSCRGSTWRGISPAMFADGDAELDLAADLLANGKTSRLYRRLVFDERIATDVSAAQNSREIGGFFQVAATAAPGHTLAEIERSIVEEIARLADRRPDRRRDGARPGAGGSAVRLPAADGRRLRRQVRSAQCLQRVRRRPGYFDRDLTRYQQVTRGVAASRGRRSYLRRAAAGDAEHRAARPHRSGDAGLDVRREVS